ncbi:NADH-quinone oxidoreductase subunit I [Microbispora sp. KK1-11]|uniref:NuoI/complex I 23 kDa subunit family protein n=1 Tax=Microbispora sp. KK1-11 TaxID=2053005 RepID=UPI0021AEAE54|nr:4Fe-4S binding protein [Microbispora sp. KK1-11]
MAKGLAVTMRHMLRKSETQQYPEVHPDLPARSRGVIALVEENCTVCMLCARECPDWCIYIDSHKETLPAPEGGRPRARNVLDRFAIDFSLCMYCGICIEVCPFDALFWSPEFEYAEYDIRDLLHEKDRLGEWAATVPPPPAHEVGAESPKELSAGSRPAPARRTAPPASVKGPAEGASVAQEAAQGPAQKATQDTARETTQDSAQDTGQDAAQDTAQDTGREAARGPAAEPAPGPESRPRREPPRAMRDIRSIRPPGSLPKNAGSPPQKKDGPEGER